MEDGVKEISAISARNGTDAQWHMRIKAGIAEELRRPFDGTQDTRVTATAVRERMNHVVHCTLAERNQSSLSLPVKDVLGLVMEKLMHGIHLG